MQTLCKCGHRREEHRGGENCEACDCVTFEEAPVITCTECGKPSTEGVCPKCQKSITDNCPGDLIPYLFGVKTDYPATDKIKAKRLAMDIRDAGLDVRTLWNHWLITKGGN